MAKRGASGRSNANGRRTGPARPPRPARSADKPKRITAKAPTPPPAREQTPPGLFRLGAVPGTTPGTWISRWRERNPGTTLELIALDVSDQRAAIDRGDVDAALVRLPIDRDGLHVISLYDEVPVVVMSVDSSLSAADELGADDLDGETVIVPSDDVLGPLTLPGTSAPSFEGELTTQEAVATVSTGVGILIVPMSLARLHHRKDITYRALREGPTSTVALAWIADRTTPDVETFVGIVRGRTTNSSR